MPIIDAHAHIFPDSLSEKASLSIGNFYNTKTKNRGSCEELLKSGDKISVKNYFVHSTATTADQVISINNFIINSCQRESKFIGFGTIHPDFKEITREFNRMEEGGIRGIKLHPDFQNCAVDDPRFDPIYEELVFRELPVLIHAGDSRFQYSNPQRFVHVLKKHPKLKLIAAHFGGYTQWDESYKYLAGKDCWFDTSSTLWALDPQKAKKILRKHGVERFLFGSDFPMWDHFTELQRLEKLDLSSKELDQILYKNATTLLI